MFLVKNHIPVFTFYIPIAEVETLKRELSFQSLVNSGRSNVGKQKI